MNNIRRSVTNAALINKQYLRCQKTGFSSEAISINSSENIKAKPWQEIPGPSNLPLLGPLHHFFPGGLLYGQSNETLPALLYKAYGPIVKFLGVFGSPTMIYVFDPDAAMHIFRNENTLPKRPVFGSLEYFRKFHNKKNEVIEPTGLLTEHGERWKTLRSTVNPVLLQPKTIRLYTDILEEVSNDMIKRMKSLRNKDNVIEKNLNVEMNLWSLESIGVVALGGRLNCFDPNLPEDSPVRKLINVVHSSLNTVEKLDFGLSLWRYFATSDFKKGMKCYEDQMKLNEYFISMAMEKLKNKKPVANEEKGILEKLLEIDPKIAVTMASEMLFAGIDTTATTIIGLLYLLAVNPQKQEKLREEIMSSEDKRPFLKACIKESLRLMPIIDGNMRETSKEYNILGYKIPKDMIIITSNQHMSRMEGYYVKPKEFIPERWIVDKNDPLYYGNTHPFVTSPFGFGVRSCIGRRIAEMEIEIFMTKLIKNFDVKWFGPEIKMQQSTLNYLVGPFDFKFIDI